MDPIQAEISRYVWETKYRWCNGPGPPEQSLEDSWRRVANALAGVEKTDRTLWAERFYRNLTGFCFLPGGRILAGAGTERRVTLFNCFVMGTIADDMAAIFDRLKESALTMQAGGGIGCDFSTLRPAGCIARDSATIASGPVSFMRIWDSMCATLLSTGSRRGAMMATLRCDHPDIEAFVAAKRDSTALRHFNLSVLVSDAFMAAVSADADWPLVFPDRALAPESGRELLECHWSGAVSGESCRVFRRVSARELWTQIMRATYDCAEPGVLFVDNINRFNNLAYRERISATNPCGEIPLPPFGACNLGSVNLLHFVRAPLTAQAALDWQGIADCAALGVRMLDNVIDLSRYPLPELERQAKGSRRLGLGITGLADALIALGLHYDSDGARRLATRVMTLLRDTAYRTSIDLASEKGSFPQLETGPFLAGDYAQTLPDEIRRAIAARGLRNSHLLAIAPTGTISLLANGVSSGVEPVFDFHHRRRVVTTDGGWRTFQIEDPVHRLWRERHKGSETAVPMPDSFVSATQIPPRGHLLMEAALQPLVDNAISKTVNVPEDLPFAAFEGLYREAHTLGLKGCTTFRPNPVTAAVLTPTSGCCDLDREGE
ncbi:Ribonucleoside-diphosphate reductase NrdZ [Microbulbifer aggregans]|uniref:Vitamin B12-dependent ribonucleotide reductase n=1 Tax=Microbulbifer aggregans TaxID=1769779 RepID=A0A1C9W5N3_9GAMM|nr:adenosylcobalamin-dependent ribonucleoside-diphosphate reductase [Microbulbifer aggregans]AOS96440.1 Ribonucleoside-diphosphate reductase NrdZ [Microbulbifer aggregans]